jgi:hypothetical protein
MAALIDPVARRKCCAGGVQSTGDAAVFGDVRFAPQNSHGAERAGGGLGANNGHQFAD